jgi:hypothetical protein
MTSSESEPADDPADDSADDDTAPIDDATQAEINGLLQRLQHLVEPRTAASKLQRGAGAAWRGATREEPRVQVTVAIVVAIGLMLALPSRVSNPARWVLPVLAVVLLIGVFIANGSSSPRRNDVLRGVSLALIGVMSIANAASAARLVIDLVRGEGVKDPAQLLLTGGAIWFTNVIVFGLWYWELDRGGPIQRALGTHQYPDFLFPQMTVEGLSPPDWEPGFIDYFYVSFTNATAFSPTDTMPMTRWAKLTMLIQSAISVITVALVIARAVNILKG